jgi:para-nitrobenzyl esterase
MDKCGRLKPFLALFALALALATIVSCGGSSNKVEQSNTGTGGKTLIADPIKLDSGYITGATIGDVDNLVKIYRGIPYAAPPVGDLRWKPPQPVEPWDGIREATAFSKGCSQLDVGFAPGPFSEDCLYVNVLTPATSADENLPVMVWFHGGGFSIGTGNQESYNTPGLPQHGAILVTVNHRLGPMGLLALPALSKESPNGVSGNYEFLDLIAALQWVQTNIAAFGGDPGNVTIFGESGGGGKSDALMASPLAEGLFQHAIYESGANVSKAGPQPITLKEAEDLGVKLVQILGADPNDLAALRAIPAEKFVQAGQDLTTQLSSTGPAGTAIADTLVVDGWFMPDLPDNIFEQGKQNDADLIVCSNWGEITATKSFLVMPDLVKGYLIRMQSQNELGRNGFATMFTQVPSNWKKDGVLAFHGLEVPYVFGYLSYVESPAMFAIFAKASGAVTQDPGLTQDDTDVSEAMMKMWVQFAKTGDPNVEGLVEWPKWDPSGDQYLDIGTPLQVKTGYSKIVP